MFVAGPSRRRRWKGHCVYIYIYVLCDCRWRGYDVYNIGRRKHANSKNRGGVCVLSSVPIKRYDDDELRSSMTSG